MNPKPLTWIHPLELRHTYRLLSTLPLANKTISEVEEISDRLANARSFLEFNSFIRKLRHESDENSPGV